MIRLTHCKNGETRNHEFRTSILASKKNIYETNSQATLTLHKSSFLVIEITSLKH